MTNDTKKFKNRQKSQMKIDEFNDKIFNCEHNLNKLTNKLFYFIISQRCISHVVRKMLELLI